MTARRAVGLVSTHVRRLGTKTEVTPRLLELLRRNHELSDEDAKAELRWMRQAARNRGEGSPGMTGGVIEMVERRSKGEPLQYILGEWQLLAAGHSARHALLSIHLGSDDVRINTTDLISTRPWIYRCCDS